MCFLTRGIPRSFSAQCVGSLLSIIQKCLLVSVKCFPVLDKYRGDLIVCSREPIAVYALRKLVGIPKRYENGKRRGTPPMLRAFPPNYLEVQRRYYLDIRYLHILTYLVVVSFVIYRPPYHAGYLFLCAMLVIFCACRNSRLAFVIVALPQ